MENICIMIIILSMFTGFSIIGLVLANLAEFICKKIFGVNLFDWLEYKILGNK